MKRLFFVVMVLVLVPLVFAHLEDEINEARQIIDSKVPCDQLSDEKLELIGEYIMEQMHPGEQHENIDNALGGEGSENLRQTHIRMARMMYCGEMVSMMNMPMMDGGMMGSNYSGNMMNNFGSFLWLWYILVFLILISLVVLIWVLVARNKKGPQRKK